MIQSKAEMCQPRNWKCQFQSIKWLLEGFGILLLINLKENKCVTKTAYRIQGKNYYNATENITPSYFTPPGYIHETI
jgi:hypothetical protein